jgi:hypothetical protein
MMNLAGNEPGTEKRGPSGQSESVPESSTRSPGQGGYAWSQPEGGSFRDCLTAVEADAATNAFKLYSVCEWLGSHGLADEGLKWLDGCDPKLRKNQPVPVAEANLYLAKMDWPDLEAFLDDQKWGELECLRLAMLARAGWGQDQSRVAEARWTGAERAAADRLGPLMLLLSLAAEWGRDQESVLWEIGRRFSREQWALRELERRYLAAGNTRGLNNVYSALETSNNNPSDWTNRNNLAATSLLLQINLSRAHQTAREIYGHNPDDPTLASTYAFSLHLQGRTQEGLAVFERLQAKALTQPPIAFYYGVLLANAGQTNRASRFLALANKARLLPEEKDLLERARSVKLPAF